MADIVNTKLIHPVTGKMTPCQIFVNNFGPGEDAIKFAKENILYSKDEIDAMSSGI